METQFICPKCGLQKATEFKPDFIVCPKCNSILALGAKTSFESIKAVEARINDLGEKLFIARRDNKDLAPAIEERLKQAQEYLKTLTS